jgi:DNA modification methylase
MSILRVRMAADAMIVRADARSLPLRDTCVDCCVTSPPYFGLRDYGDPAQIGLEATPEAYVATIVAVFREVKRLLKDSGTLWLNLGDSYAGSGAGGGGNNKGNERGQHDLMAVCGRPRPSESVKPKDLVGIPWRVAFALQADGWYLRSDIIWSKPNPMPESVTDRPTKAHEYLFLLAKSERYYYDAAAIAEAAIRAGDWNNATPQHAEYAMSRVVRVGDMRNKRSVWTVATMPYSGAHFATFPEALIEPCVLAGCPLGGLVLDPFCGTFTVGAVAARTGRRAVGVDLTYQTLARERTAQRGLMFATEETA